MICRYGDTVTLSDSRRSQQEKAIIQPLMYKNKMYLGGTILPAGVFDGGHYIMIMPAQSEDWDYSDMVIKDGVSSYIIKRSEVIRADDCDLYVWAVLTPYGGKAEDDYEDNH